MVHPKNGTLAVLDDLAVFVAVAQHTSFAAASRQLALPTSSVSRAVARLENALGVSLLRRTSRSVVATEEGRALLLGAADPIDNLREALAAVTEQQPEPSGHVRVTAPAFTGATRVAASLAAFAKKYPRISLELDASNAVRDLLHDGYDFGIRVGPRVHPDFVARPYWRSQFGLFAAPALVKRVLRGKTRLSRAQLEAAPCIVLRAPIRWTFVDIREQSTEITPRAHFVVNDPRSAVDVARSGVGIVLAPLEAVPARDRSLVRLTTELGEPRAVELFIVYPTRRLLPVRVRLAVDWLIAHG